jgi:hypothetical protein
VPFQICNGPFQISNGPQLWLVKLRASLCIDKYHFLDLIGQWWQITSYWTMVTDNKLLDNGDK